MEVGAGTGGTTQGFISNVQVEIAVITDISEKLLGICKKKLESGSRTGNQIIYATYSTNEDILPENKFDLIFGTFVLHHILDYKKAFRQFEAALIDGGQCFFVEPNYQYHNALIGALIDVLEVLLRIRQIDANTTLFANWIYEVLYNVKYSGDHKMLEGREDKHMFNPSLMRELLKTYNFQSVEILNWGEEDLGLGSLASYLPQLGISKDYEDLVYCEFKKVHNKYFKSLIPENSSPANIYFFKK